MVGSRESDSPDALRDNALEMLQERSIQERLATLFASYLRDVQPIVIAATVQRGGVRPEGLENEIYSCFHHVARGLCYKKSVGEARDEVRRGEETHLKRLLLDAYKIAIRPYLEEYQFIVRELYELSLDKDFNPDVYGVEPIKKVQRILEIKTVIKESYREAKYREALGDVESAVKSFYKALKGCYDLTQAIHAMMTEDMYLVAHAHIARRQAERDADRRENRRNNYIAWAIAFAAVIVAVCAWLFPR